jgi:hypothetical protein
VHRKAEKRRVEESAADIERDLTGCRGCHRQEIKK